MILTDPDAGSLTRWRLPPAFYPDAEKPPLTYHRTPERWRRGDGYCTVQSASRGQEFVLDTARYPGVTDWLSMLLAEQQKGEAADKLSYITRAAQTVDNPNPPWLMSRR